MMRPRPSFIWMPWWTGVSLLCLAVAVSIVGVAFPGIWDVFGWLQFAGHVILSMALIQIGWCFILAIGLREWALLWNGFIRCLFLCLFAMAWPG